MKAYLDLIIVGVIILAVVGYTAYQRHDAVVGEQGRTAAATTETIIKVQKVKNEIRNRPMSDRATIERLRSLTY